MGFPVVTFFVRKDAVSARDTAVAVPRRSVPLGSARDGAVFRPNPAPIRVRLRFRLATWRRHRNSRLDSSRNLAWRAWCSPSTCRASTTRTIRSRSTRAQSPRMTNVAMWWDRRTSIRSILDVLGVSMLSGRWFSTSEAQSRRTSRRREQGVRRPRDGWEESDRPADPVCGRPGSRNAAVVRDHRCRARCGYTVGMGTCGDLSSARPRIDVSPQCCHTRLGRPQGVRTACARHRDGRRRGAAPDGPDAPERRHERGGQLSRVLGQTDDHRERDDTRALSCFDLRRDVVCGVTQDAGDRRARRTRREPMAHRPRRVSSSRCGSSGWGCSPAPCWCGRCSEVRTTGCRRQKSSSRSERTRR